MKGIKLIITIATALILFSCTTVSVMKNGLTYPSLTNTTEVRLETIQLNEANKLYESIGTLTFNGESDLTEKIKNNAIERARKMGGNVIVPGTTMHASSPNGFVSTDVIQIHVFRDIKVLNPSGSKTDNI